MSPWTINEFVAGNKRKIFTRWLSGLDVEARERIKALIRRLRVSPIAMWSRPYVAPISSHKGIVELRIKANNIQYRPLGCYGPGPHTFTILVGSYKKGKQWEPQNALKTADKRRPLALEGGGYVEKYEP